MVCLAEKEITLEFKKPEIAILLAVLVLFFCVELQVTLNSRVSFGDEGYHLRVAQEIAKYVDYPAWLRFRHTEVSDRPFNRPPIWNMLLASFFFLGFNEVVPKILAPFAASILTGIAVYVLVKKLYNKVSGLFAAIIMAAVPSIVTYAVLLYTDTLFVFYFTLSTLAFILANVENRKKYWILAAVFGALSVLTKTPGYLIVVFAGLAFLYWVFLIKVKKYQGGSLTGVFKKYALFALLFSIIVVPFFVRNYVYYGVIDCNAPVPMADKSGCEIEKYKSNLADTRTAASGGTEESPLKMGLTNYINFSYGELWFVPLSFLCGAYILAKRRNLRNALVLLSIVGYLIVMTDSLVNPSSRSEDISRFTLGWVPIIAMISGVFFEGVYRFVSENQKYLSLLVIIVVIFMSYLSIVGMSVGGINIAGKASVMSSVKVFSPAFFEACDWARKNLKEEDLLMTVWVHQTAYNCQTRVTGCEVDILLSSNATDMVDVAKTYGITHIFVQKGSISSKPASEKYPLDFVNVLGNNPDKFVKVFENGPSVSSCVQQGGCDGTVIYEIKY